jgi:hypothetical protein
LGNGYPDCIRHRIAALFASHNEKARTVKLPGLGMSLALGEKESGEGNQPRHRDDD